MNNARDRLIHIHHCHGVGWKTIRAMLQDDPTLQKIYSYSTADLKEKYLMNEKQASLFHQDLRNEKILYQIEKYPEKLISMLTIFDNDYPYLLKQIYDHPQVLYLKGNRGLLTHSKWISIVGTRAPSPSGREAVKMLSEPLINAGWGIVSGLAAGIDSEAHRAALEHNGKTMAVLGSGFHHIYPNENKQLAMKLTEKNLLVSEYPPNTKPERWRFPMRNRLISGLSTGTIVIEAKEKSGSLITADQALDQNREVFAVPGSIFEERARGTNRLIQNGAKLVLGAEDILCELL